MQLNPDAPDRDSLEAQRLAGSLDPVEEVMARCLEAPEHEWAEALERAAHEHPELADELRHRLRLLLHHDLPPVPASAWVAPPEISGFAGLELLGSGGMGLVYRARELSLDRDVALKLIRPERLYFDGALARFQREVETVARLKHTGIVSIHSVGAAQGGALPYFAMELLEGATLADVLNALDGRAPESLQGTDLFEAIGGQGAPPATFQGSWVDAVVRVCLQVGQALVHAHGQGVLHRDVKPSNVMVERSGRVVLIDFGLTAPGLEGAGGAAARMTAPGRPVGTLVYMAPERLTSRGDSDTSDVRSDVYALGVTLYEMLALQPPYAGETSLEIERAIVAGGPDRLRARNRLISRDVETVVAQAMALRAGDRYPDAAELCADLEALLARRPVAARPPGAPERVVRWAQRRPALASAVALAVALGVGAPSVFWWQAERHRDALAARLTAETAAKEAALEANRELEDMAAFTLGMFERADPERNGGRVPDAREMLQLGADELGRLDSRPRSQARVELALGELFGALSDSRSAQPHLDAAIAYYSQRVADDATDLTAVERLARALRHSGHNLDLQRRFEEANAQLERALELASGLFAEADPRLIPYLSSLADHAQQTGAFERALALRARCVATLEARGLQDAELARVRGLLGVAYKESGDLVAARPLLADALAWDDERTRDPERRSEASLGTERARFELTLGDLEKLEGRFDAALALAQSAFAGLNETRGPDHLLTLQARMALAEALARLARFDEALPELEALAVQLVQRLPREHPVVLRVRQMQLAALIELGRQAEVAPLCEALALVAAFQRTLGPTHPNTLSVLRADALSRQARGEPLLCEAALERLEAAERAASPWSGDHADAVLMLVAHRAQARAVAAGGEGRDPFDPTPSRALLSELLDAIGGSGLRATSAITGEDYDVEAAARQFLAALAPR